MTLDETIRHEFTVASDLAKARRVALAAILAAADIAEGDDSYVAGQIVEWAHELRKRWELA